jgi:hypothetical protein
VSHPATLTTLAGLAHDINEGHAAVQRSLVDALTDARLVGDRLRQAKSMLRHGEWLPWLTRHCTVSPRQAQRYIRLAEHWPTIEANATSTSHLSLSGALALLAEPAESSEASLEHAQTLEREVAVIRERLAECAATLERTDLTLEDAVAVRQAADDCCARAREIRLRAERGLGRSIQQLEALLEAIEASRP